MCVTYCTEQAEIAERDAGENHIESKGRIEVRSL